MAGISYWATTSSVSHNATAIQGTTGTQKCDVTASGWGRQQGPAVDASNIDFVVLNYSSSVSTSDDALTYGYYIATSDGSVILAAADSGGTPAIATYDVASSTLTVSGAIKFPYVNQTASAANWDDATVYVTVTAYTASMANDNGYVVTSFGPETPGNFSEALTALVVGHGGLNSFNPTFSTSPFSSGLENQAASTATADIVTSLNDTGTTTYVKMPDPYTGIGQIDLDAADITNTPGDFPTAASDTIFFIIDPLVSTLSYSDDTGGYVEVSGWIAADLDRTFGSRDQNPNRQNGPAFHSATIQARSLNVGGLVGAVYGEKGDVYNIGVAGLRLRNFSSNMGNDGAELRAYHHGVTVYYVPLEGVLLAEDVESTSEVERVGGVPVTVANHRISSSATNNGQLNFILGDGSVVLGNGQHISYYSGGSGTTPDWTIDDSLATDIKNCFYVSSTDSIVFLSTGNSAKMYSVDRTTGNVLWELTPTVTGPYVWPYVSFDTAGEYAWTADEANGIIKVDLTNGNVVLNIDSAGFSGKTIAMLGADVGRNIVVVSVGNSDPRVLVFNATTGAKVAEWHPTITGGTLNSGYTMQYCSKTGYVSAFSYTGTRALMAFDAVTGSVIWQVTTDTTLNALGEQTGINGTLMYEAGAINSNNFVHFDAATGDVISCFSASGGNVLSPNRRNETLDEKTALGLTHRLAALYDTVDGSEYVYDPDTAAPFTLGPVTFSDVSYTTGATSICSVASTSVYTTSTATYTGATLTGATTYSAGTSTGTLTLTTDPAVTFGTTLPTLTEGPPPSGDTLLADDVESLSELTTPNINTTLGILADDVQSLSELTSPLVGQEHTLTATSVETTSELTSPVLAEMIMYNLLADDVQSLSELTTPALAQEHTLLSTSVESLSELTVPEADENNIFDATDVESASNLTIPVVGQSHVLLSVSVESTSELTLPTVGEANMLLADDVQSLSELTSPVVAQVQVLDATDLESLSELTSPVIAQDHTLTSVSVESLSELTSPNLSEVNILTANSVASLSELTSPAIAQAHTLANVSVESLSELTSPLVGQEHGLTATSVESISELTLPTVSEGSHALLAVSVESLSELTVPEADETNIFDATDVQSSSQLSIPVIGQTHIADATDVQSISELTSPVVGQEHTLSATSVESTSELTLPTAAESDHSLLADDVESLSELTLPTMAAISNILADDVESLSELTSPTVAQVQILDATDVESLSELTLPTLSDVAGQDNLLANDVESASEVTAPATAQIYNFTAISTESSSETTAPAVSQEHSLGAASVESATILTFPTVDGSEYGKQIDGSAVKVIGPNSGATMYYKGNGYHSI